MHLPKSLSCFSWITSQVNSAGSPQLAAAFTSPGCRTVISASSQRAWNNSKEKKLFFFFPPLESSDRLNCPQTSHVPTSQLCAGKCKAPAEQGRSSKMNLSPNPTALGTGEVGEGWWWHPHQTPQFTWVSPPQWDRGCISKHPNSARNRAACPHLFLERHSRGTSLFPFAFRWSSRASIQSLPL